MTGSNQPPRNPVAILVRGMPGSGKSHLSRALQLAIGEDQVVILDPDVTDYESEAYKAHTAALTAEGVDPKLHAYRFLRGQAYAGIEVGKVIIWNQAFTNREIFNLMISRLREHATAHHQTLAILVVEIEIDPAVAKARVAARAAAGGHGVSDDAHARFVADYVSFADEGYPTVILRGEDEVQQSVAAVLQSLHKLGR